MSKLTIRDIARMAGVSTTAVSFVLNNRGGVSETTRQKVQEIIERTGFTPNVHTRRLILGKSLTVHVVLQQHNYDLANQFALDTLSGIFKASNRLGYSIIFTFAEEPADPNQVIESVRSKDCDGIILYQIADTSLISLLQKEQIPFVCVDAHITKDGSLPMVEVDYFDAAYQATLYLHRCGHKEIGFVGPTAPAEYYISTFNGYSAALKGANLVCNPAWMTEISFMEGSAASCVEQLLRAPHLPTALLCAGDAYAIDLIRCLKSKGLHVPEDISIMSMDDLMISRHLDPPLSTMSFPKEQLGEQAMQLLYQIMSQEDYTAVNLIKTAPVERNTVKKL